MSVRMIPASFVTRTLGAADRRGADLRPALRLGGITERELADPDTRLTTEQVADFMSASWDLTDDELLGMGLAPAPRGTFQLITFAVIHCPDLDSVLRRLAGFLPVIPSSAPVQIDFLEDRVRIWFDITELPNFDEDTSLIADFGLLLIHRFAAWLTGQRIEPIAVELPHRSPNPVDIVAYHHMFGIPVSFNADVPALEIAAADLSSPIVQTEATLQDFLRQSPRNLLSVRDYDTGMEARVRRIVELSAGGRQASAADLASALAISEPQLRRRLRQEGTSVNKVRDGVLRDAAVAALDAGESVDSISARLGFSEPSAFRRAFKRWTGQTPGSYR